MIQQRKRTTFDLSGTDVWQKNLKYRKTTPTQKSTSNRNNAEFEKKTWILTDEEKYKRIGSNEDFGDSTLEASYDWDTKISPHVLSSADEGSRIKTLKRLCAMKIAENEDLLNLQLLESGTWATWAIVWDYIVSWRRDNFLLFQLFAGAFSKEDTFSCHVKFDNCSETKKKVVMTSILPNAKNHRVERLFGNVKIPQFVESLNFAAFKNLIFLNLDKPVNNDDMLSLTNLANLLTLKISRINSITDSTILTWCSSLKSQKWKNLQILSLPEISQYSMIKLQQVAEYCRLTYIEVQSKTRFNMEKDWGDVDFKDWELINDRALNNLPWGLKSLTILKKYKIQERTYLPNHLIFLDFSIMNHTYNERFHDRQEEYDQLWNMSGLQTYYQGVVLKRNLKKAYKQTNVQKAAGVTKRQVLKPRIGLKTTSLNSFFDLKR